MNGGGRGKRTCSLSPRVVRQPPPALSWGNDAGQAQADPDVRNKGRQGGDRSCQGEEPRRAAAAKASLFDDRAPPKDANKKMK